MARREAPTGQKHEEIVCHHPSTHSASSVGAKDRLTSNFRLEMHPADSEHLTPPPLATSQHSRHVLTPRRSHRSARPILLTDELDDRSRHRDRPDLPPQITSSRSDHPPRRTALPATPVLSGTEAVYSFRLLEALRKGDQKALHPFLSKAVPSKGPVNELTSPLHIAARCAECKCAQPGSCVSCEHVVSRPSALHTQTTLSNSAWITETSISTRSMRRMATLPCTLPLPSAEQTSFNCC